MIKMHKRTQYCISIFVLTILVSLSHFKPLFAKIRFNDEQHQKEMEQIKSYVKEKDFVGLIPFLAKGEVRSKVEAAKWLGEFGEEIVVPILEELDNHYSNFLCYPTDEFGVAVTMIKNKNKSKEEKIKALKLSKEYKYNGYAAVRAVMKLESQYLLQEHKISRYVKILKEHKTAQLAEAAQDLLIEIGEPAVNMVVDLLNQIDAGQAKTLHESFNTNATVSSRCIRILSRIRNKVCILAIGDKLNDGNLYIKGIAVSALQEITGEKFGFDFADLGMGTHKDEFQKNGQEHFNNAQLSIKKTQEWWKKNRDNYVVKK